jgi:hypothetical protein
MIRAQRTDPARRALVAGCSAVSGMLAVASVAWACTVTAGATFFSDGASSKAVARGDRISAFATGAELGFEYVLVIGDPNSIGPDRLACFEPRFQVSPSRKTPNDQGFIAQTAGPAGDAAMPPGLFHLCFRAVGPSLATGPAILTLI